MRAAPDALVARLQGLGEILFEQEHRLFRTTLPDNYRPGRHADPNLRPLRLSPRDMAELRGAILKTRLDGLDVAEAIQTAMFDKSDQWVEEERARLRAELRGIWQEQPQ